MVYTLSENYIMEFFRAIKDEFISQVQVGDIGEGIQHAITTPERFALDIAGLHIPFTDTVISTWIAMAFIAILGFWLGKKFDTIPKGKQIISEGYVDLIMNLCKGQNMSQKQAESVAPFIGSMAVFICISNCFSVFKVAPPSKDPVFPITLALFTIFYVIFTGIRLVGIKGFIGSLKYPKPALMPFRILDYFIKPISLSLRLFGNIFGAFILMEFIYIIVPFIVPGVLGIWFDLADGILQAGVFAYLSAVYIGEIIEGAHGDASNKNERKAMLKKALSA